MTIRPPILNYRQKALIGLLRAFGGRLSNIDFQKYLFLYVQEFQSEPVFEFVPYRFGCFSFQSYADKRRLIEVGMLHESDDWRLKEESGQSDFGFGEDLLACLGIFEPVELRQTGLERRHWDAEETDGCGADCCVAPAD